MKWLYRFRHEAMLCALGLVFLASRFFTLIAAGSLWFDEAFSAHIASLPWAQAKELLAYEHNPWLPFDVLRGAIHFWGNSDAALRFPSLIAGFGALILLVWTGNRMFAGKTAGLAAGFFLTISTLHLYHQTEARMYALVTLFAGISLALAWEWLKAERLRVQHWLLFAYILSTTALIHTHVTAWPFVALLWFCVGLEAAHAKRASWLWHGANLLPFLTGMLWFAPVLMARLSIPGTSQGWFFTQNQDSYFFAHIVSFLFNGEDRLPIRSLGAMLLGLVFTASIVEFDRPTWWQKIRHVFDQEHWPLSLRFDWSRPVRLLFLLFAGTMLIGFAGQVTVTKYLITASVPLFLLLGHGLSKLQGKLLNATIAAFILLALPMHIRLLEKRHHWDDAAKQVSALQQEYPDSITVVHSFAYALPLHRYVPDTVTLDPFYPLNDGLTFDQAMTRYNWRPIVTAENVVLLEDGIAERETVILVSSTQGSGEQDPVKRYLWQGGWKLVEQYRYTGYGDPEILVFRR